MFSYRLQSHTTISSPEKSWNKTRVWKKYYIFSRVFDIANQLRTLHSPFVPLGQVDEWTTKLLTFSIHGCLSKFPRIMAVKTLKNPYRLQTLTLKVSLKRKNYQDTERKPER